MASPRDPPACGLSAAPFIRGPRGCGHPVAEERLEWTEATSAVQQPLRFWRLGYPRPVGAQARSAGGGRGTEALEWHGRRLPTACGQTTASSQTQVTSARSPAGGRHATVGAIGPRDVREVSHRDRLVGLAPTEIDAGPWPRGLARVPWRRRTACGQPPAEARNRPDVPRAQGARGRSCRQRVRGNGGCVAPTAHPGSRSPSPPRRHSAVLGKT